MNKQIHPLALIGVIVVVVVLLVVFGYRALQPAPYTPSPGAAGTSGPVPGSTSKSGGDAPGYYPAAPAGSIPGKPLSQSGGTAASRR